MLGVTLFYTWAAYKIVASEIACYVFEIKKPVRGIALPAFQASALKRAYWFAKFIDLKTL